MWDQTMCQIPILNSIIILLLTDSRHVASAPLLTGLAPCLRPALLSMRREEMLAF